MKEFTKKINFKASTILNKKFDTELSGYSAKEVDLFFDKVIEDYNTLERTIEILQEKIQNVNDLSSDKDATIELLKNENETIKIKLEQTSKATNVALYEEMRGLRSDLKFKNDKK